MLIVRFGGEDTEDRIRQLEARYDLTLPQPYRNFLLRYNGGFTPKTRFRRGRLSSDLRGFYGLGPVALSLETLPLNQWLERDLLPVACDSFGNFLALGVRGEDKEVVVFADHEKGMAATPLAKDFPALLALCKSNPIPEGARRSIEERRALLIANGRENAITPALVAMWQAEIDKYRDMVQEEVVLS